MNLADITLKITKSSNVDNTVYTDAERVIDINIWQHKVQSVILGSADEVDFDDNNQTDYPELTTPLVASQRDYSIPKTEKVISIKRVDISYDGVNYYRATPIDTGEITAGLGPSSDTTQQTKTDALFDRTAPRYDVAYNSVFIYPSPTATDVANGGKIFIEWNREIKEITSSDLTSGTLVPGFDTAFHPILYLGPVRDFLRGTGQNTDADEYDKDLQEYWDLLIKTYGKKQIDRNMSLTPLPDSYK